MEMRNFYWINAQGTLGDTMTAMCTEKDRFALRRGCGSEGTDGSDMDTIIDLFEMLMAIGFFFLITIVIFGGMPRLFDLIVDRFTLETLKRMAQSQGVELEDLDIDKLSDRQAEALINHGFRRMQREAWKDD